MMLRHFIRCVAATTFFLSISGCGDRESTAGLVERELSSSEREFKLAESSTERFRYQTRPAAGGDSSAPGSGGGGGPKLVFTTPEGWTDKGASMMRDINFSFGEKGEGECYVARLPGAGGGLLANVNRWRSQMGAEALTEEQVAALPVKPLFGQPARFVTVDGTYSPGMGTTDTFANYRLMGLILASDAGAVFVKMTGPKELVTKNEAAFDQFTQSIDVNTN